MSRFPRANWIALLSIVVASVFAVSHSTGQDRAVAQVGATSATPGASLTASPRYTWSYLDVKPVGSNVVIQVLPPGTSGIFHGVRTYNGSMDIFDGPTISSPQIGTILDNSNSTLSEDFDVRFENGLTVRSFGGPVTFLYKLDNTTVSSVDPE